MLIGTAALLVWDVGTAVLSNDDISRSDTQQVATPTVEPIVGESAQDFTTRVTNICREACTDKAVDDYMEGLTDSISPDDIGRCTHACVDAVLEDTDPQYFDDEPQK